MVVAFLGVGSMVLVTGSNREERMECEFWQSQAKQYPSYYLTHWQKEQCDHDGIAIDVPVK